jgi:hypothetical protein
MANDGLDSSSQLLKFVTLKSTFIETSTEKLRFVVFFFWTLNVR